jgi:hypothetical protein
MRASVLMRPLMVPVPVRVVPTVSGSSAPGPPMSSVPSSSV